MQSTSLSNLSEPSGVENLVGNLATNSVNFNSIIFVNKNKPIFFKNGNHTYKATIQELEGRFGYTVKIGGNTYQDCINISISPDENNNFTIATIGHIQSEKECSFSSFLNNNETVQFVKAALSFCKMKFPNILRFKFADMSKIDCGISKKNIPPRTHEKPFSLPHFSIAKYGMTWYEQKFNAKMSPEESYIHYINCTKVIFTAINMSFDEFVKKSNMTSSQAEIIQPYFLKAKSWSDLFRSIPKNLQCNVLYNWLEDFICDLIDNSFIPYRWYIDATTMDYVPVEIIENIQIGGMKKTRRNKKIRGTRMYHDTNSSMNFGGGYMGE
jgi:hypothetical protein